jgi:hypothetical protein
MSPYGDIINVARQKLGSVLDGQSFAEFEESDRADVPFRAELRTSQRPLVRRSLGRDILTTGGCASRGIHV